VYLLRQSVTRLFSSFHHLRFFLQFDNSKTHQNKAQNNLFLILKLLWWQFPSKNTKLKRSPFWFEHRQTNFNRLWKTTTTTKQHHLPFKNYSTYSLAYWFFFWQRKKENIPKKKKKEPKIFVPQKDFSCPHWRRRYSTSRSPTKTHTFETILFLRIQPGPQRWCCFKQLKQIFFPTSRTLEHRPGQLTFPTTTYPLTCFSSSLLSQCICAPLPLAPFDSFYTIFDYRPPGSDCRLEFSAHPSLLYSTETKSKTHPNLFLLSPRKKKQAKKADSAPPSTSPCFSIFSFFFFQLTQHS